MMLKPAIPYCMTFALLAATGCSRHLSNANLNQVHDNMTIKEVESILGPPTRYDSHVELPQQATVKVTHYFYEQDGKTVELVFYGDNLAIGNGGKAAITGTFDK